MHDELRQIIEPLIGWYDENKRLLPWREDKEPYHVWISEIMLQQTRIEAVIRYYARFMQALPDTAALSSVEDDKLMKLWEGLGYYSRARNLKKAACVVMQDYGGVFPRSYAELRKLPGIGEYTAGAIASICFDEPVPAVDGNVLRVIARLTADRANVLLPDTKKRAAERLRALMPARAGAFNEALMELGEILCLPNGAPICERCPLSAFCAACRGGLTGELPVRIKVMKRKRAALTVLLLRDADGRLAIEKRPDKGLLAGMYQLPNLNGHLSADEITAALREWGMEPDEPQYIKDAKHVFTHIDWDMKGWRVNVVEGTERFLWVTEEELRESYPLPTAFQKLLS